MKIAFFFMLLALTMAETTERETSLELEAGNNILCAASAILIFYAPLHTIAYCLLNTSQGWQGCLDEVLLMGLSAASIYTAGCVILP